MSTAANEASLYGGTGAGGKLRRKPLRNSQSTPYDRPPIAFRNPSSGNGWVSKIIDPASKIITASAHRLFSSLFRKRLLPPPFRQQTPPPPPVTSLPASEVGRISNSESRGEIQEKVGDQYGTGHYDREPDFLGSNGINQGFYELEKILEQKTFTKSEIDRLTALLNSRTIEAPAESNKNAPEAKASETVHTNGNLEAPRCTPVLDDGIKLEKYLGVSFSPMEKAKVFEEDIATPAELAKAYMGSRASKVSPSMLGSRGLATRNDVPLTNNVVFSSQSPSMNTSIKPSSRLITPEYGYMTPRPRGRSAIYNMARTPYSSMQKSSDIRSGNSFQSTQLASEPNKLSSLRQTTLKRHNSVLEDDIGSVGPIQRIRQKPGILPTQRFNGPSGIGSPGLVSVNRSKDAGNGTSRANIMSVPSHSREVAQKILQQLDKLSPSPKEKLHQDKSKQPQGRMPFILTPDMLTGQALRSLENIDSSKFIESSQEKSKLNDSVQRVTTIDDYDTMNVKNRVEENGSKQMTSFVNSKSATSFDGSDCPLARNKRAFQMSAHEDYLDLDDNDGRSNATSFSVVKDKENLVNSSLGNKTQMVRVVAAKENSVSNKEKTNVSIDPNKKKSDQDQAASSGAVIPEKNDKFSYSAGTSDVTIQPTESDNAPSSMFGKVSSGMQSTTTALFGHGAKIADKFTPIASLSSAQLANDSLAAQTSAPSESKTPNLSIPSNAAITKLYDDKGAQGTGEKEGNPSTISLYGVATTSTLLSSGSYANKRFANGSFSDQPTIASAPAPLSDLKNVSDDGAHYLDSSARTAFATSVPKMETGITSGDNVNPFSNSAAPFSASPVFSFGPSCKKDEQVSSNANGSLSDVQEKLKPVSAFSNIISNSFGGSGPSGISNNTKDISPFGSSTSSSIIGNQGLGSISNVGNDIISQAPSIGTAAENASKSTPFQFGASGFLATPSFGSSGTAAFASAGAAFSVSAPPANVFGSNTTHGLNSLPSSKEVTTMGSTSGSANSLFGSNWRPNSSSIFGSTTSSSTNPLSVFSAASSASIPTSSMPGSLFGSTGASAGSAFSFTSASANTSPSQYSASQPVNPNPVFAFGSAASSANNGSNNNQMSMEDTMAEDTVQASALSTPVFGQQQSLHNPGFVFGSPPPSVTQAMTGIFQFGSQPSPAAPVNQTPFQAPGSFNAGGSFSLGTGGGDKSGRKIIKIKKGPKRR